MGRQRQPEIRERLLDACTDHALEHGLPDRLQPLVRATGTSARMLLYHFGTRDDLLREVLRRARRRQREVFEELVRPRDDEPYPTTLARAWSGMTGPGGRPYLALFGWLRQDAEQQLWPGFAREATTDWLAPLEHGLRTVGHPGLASVVLAVVRGLVMDLESTGDATRVDRAFADFLDVLTDLVVLDRASGRSDGSSTTWEEADEAVEQHRAGRDRRSATLARTTGAEHGVGGRSSSTRRC